jgi:hypothetical protein
MERLETLFGSLPLQKVGTFNLADDKKIRDLYAARLVRSKVTDSTVVLMFAVHSDKNPGTARLSDVEWDTFMVRSYPHVDAFKAAMRALDANTLAGLKGVRVQAPKWGNDEDIVLTASKRTQDYTMYQAEGLNFSITGFDCHNHFGNSLENQVELIPLLTSYNFAITK